MKRLLCFLHGHDFVVNYLGVTREEDFDRCERCRGVRRTRTLIHFPGDPTVQTRCRRCGDAHPTALYIGAYKVTLVPPATAPAESPTP